jgi:hypothetical protein
MIVNQGWTLSPMGDALISPEGLIVSHPLDVSPDGSIYVTAPDGNDGEDAIAEISGKPNSDAIRISGAARRAGARMARRAQQEATARALYREEARVFAHPADIGPDRETPWGARY